MGHLPEVSARAAVRYPYFPTTWQAVIFRNWGHVPVNRLCSALQMDEKTLRREAAAMGLDGSLQPASEWLERGYLTIIRENWHLLTFDQLLILLGISAERLAFLLKEDDFLWHKMGQIKPTVMAPIYKALNAEEEERTAHIKDVLMDEGFANARDNAFGFVASFTRPVSDEERNEAITYIQKTENLRTVYSYFALYGDPLADPALDPFPEALLSEYARMGVKGVWLQGLLYQLVPFHFAPEMSLHHQQRIRALNALIKRAGSYGIGVYLYLNEPRAMDSAFFDRHPNLRGKREGDFYAMCTSQPEVREYLEDAVYRLFSSAPGLAGFITITMSENLTNCYSRRGDGVPCPRCATTSPAKIIAEVNNLMARGAHRADPSARAIAWNWAWGEEWAADVPALLTEGQIVQCTSEEKLETNIAGVKGAVSDYSMSLAGPGPKAKAVWKAAQEAGLETSAKTQFNNTWELSAVPWLPVMDKVAEHVENLKNAGVKHLQMSWTLGGYPSPNLKLAASLIRDEYDVSGFLKAWLGEDLGNVAYLGQRALSQAFGEFPFNIGTLYVGPQNFGPMAPFFSERTDWRATMIGFPYDDLDGWRSIYSRDQFVSQLHKLTTGWRHGIELLAEREGEHPGFDELLLMARAALCHFESSYRHTAYIIARDNSNRQDMLIQLQSERSNVREAIRLRQMDSRIGYEASNHYYYTLNDLFEKLINLEYLESQLLV